jgi:hypothetical protein
LDIAVDQVCIRMSRMQLVDVHKLGGQWSCRVGAGGGRDLEGGGQSALAYTLNKTQYPTLHLHPFTTFHAICGFGYSGTSNSYISHLVRTTGLKHHVTLIIIKRAAIPKPAADSFTRHGHNE